MPASDQSSPASVAGVIAERLDDEPLSHALYLIEDCLLDVERRIESLPRR